MKRPPEKKLLLAVAVLIVAASTMLARATTGLEHKEMKMNSIVLGVR